MNDHEDNNGRHENEVVNFEGVLPHNPPDDDDDNEVEEEEEEYDDDNDDDDDDDDTADSSENEEESDDNNEKEEEEEEEEEEDDDNTVDSSESESESENDNEEESDDYGDDEDEYYDNDSDNSTTPDSTAVVPTPDQLVLEYTYPNDFVEGRSWRTSTYVRHFFRLLIDPSCTKIPKHKFRSCRFLTELFVPDNSCLTQIGSCTFYGCKNLQRINQFPEGMIEFGKYAFGECASLEGRITIPRNVRYFRDHCFERCSSLTSVVFDTDLIMEAAAVASNGPVIELGEGIFFCCDELRSVRLPYNIIEIPRS